MPDFTNRGTPISAAGLKTAGDAVGVGAAEIWTIMAVETSGCGFLADRRPKILFERHIFSRLTQRRFDATHPDISDPTAGGYGAGGAHQYDRLAVAIGLDRNAALQSASWGLGQIMGENHTAAGFPSVDAMVDAMVDSEDNQLGAMAKFLTAGNAAARLRQHDWTGFARIYNGPNFAINEYDKKLADHFTRYAAGPLPDLRVRTAQVYLTYRQFNPGGIDGVLGRNTTNAVKAFQATVPLPQTGVIDDALLAALAV
jgi:hypothetical protein